MAEDAALAMWTVRIRKTNETPPRISIIDVAIAVTGKTHHYAAQDYRRLLNQYPELGHHCFPFKFPGRGQRDTPVVDVRGIVEIVMLLPGRHAARVRRQAAELLVRYLGGDLSLVDTVCATRGCQEAGPSASSLTWFALTTSATEMLFGLTSDWLRKVSEPFTAQVVSYGADGVRAFFRSDLTLPELRRKASRWKKSHGIAFAQVCVEETDAWLTQRSSAPPPAARDRSRSPVPWRQLRLPFGPAPRAEASTTASLP